MTGLTERQKKLYDYIRKYTQQNGIAPTFKEMQYFLKIKSISTVSYYLDSMERKKWMLPREKGNWRSVVLIHKPLYVVESGI